VKGQRHPWHHLQGWGSWSLAPPDRDRIVDVGKWLGTSIYVRVGSRSGVIDLSKAGAEVHLVRGRVVSRSPAKEIDVRRPKTTHAEKRIRVVCQVRVDRPGSNGGLAGIGYVIVEVDRGPQTYHGRIVAVCNNIAYVGVVCGNYAPFGE
jgi:hypothetical protein